jgi:hypothetical protein
MDEFPKITELSRAHPHDDVVWAVFDVTMRDGTVYHEVRLCGGILTMPDVKRIVPVPG